MKVYEDYGNSVLTKESFISILEFIQTFVWRRFILGLPTNALNKIFMNLYDKVEKSNYLFSVQKAILLRAGAQRFPKDSETINALKEKDFYNIKPKNRIYMLQRLENFENRETVLIEGNENITIEHIFPQNPEQKWKIELGNEEYSIIKENYLNTISNLTLSGNNAKLGNKTFIEKRDMSPGGYKDSRLWLNKYLSEIDIWTLKEIEKRNEILSERFLKIWPSPEIDITETSQYGEVNIFEADDPRNKKLEYAVFLDQKIELKEVAKLYAEIFKRLFELQPETFFTTDLGTKIGLTKNPTPGSPRQAVAINDTYYIEGNLDSNSKFEKLKYALKEFEFEDELLIKYADN